MAAILEKILAKDVSPEQLLSWLKSTPGDDVDAVLQNLVNVKADFMPYFLNYLRDQTSHLLQGCRSTSTTPAKTPTTAKLRRLTTITLSQDTNHTTDKVNRQQLFSTPLDIKNKSLDKSIASDSSLSRTGSAPRKTTRNKSREGSTKSQRSIQFTDAKSKQKASLADFLKSPDIDNRTRRNAHGPKWDDGSPALHSGKKAGGRAKGGHHVEKGIHHVEKGGHHVEKGGHHAEKGIHHIPKAGHHTERVVHGGERSVDRKQKPSPAGDKKLSAGFSLGSADEFPPMAVTDDRGSQLPDGVKVITASRRIAPTRITKTSKSEDNQLFRNAPLVAEAPKPRGVWGHMASRDTDKSSPSAARSKPSRRIAPTMLSDVPTTTTSIFTLSPIVTAPMTTVAMGTSVKTERTLHESTTSDDTVISEEGKPQEGASRSELTPLKKRLEAADWTTEAGVPAVTPTKQALERMMSVDLVPADRNLVTDCGSLDLLANLYTLCINAFLVPNITIELYFCVQVLTARAAELDYVYDISKDLDEVQYFSSIHNAVYFAVHVLSGITGILGHLDRGTLRMLMDNQRISEFSPDLKERISDLYNHAPSNSLPKSLPSPIGGVSFQADTDNRKNFPSERSFHLFKKQRDGFYELLREWEEHHLVPGWCMMDVQADRIQKLVGHRTELANHIHFVRLFRSQLIQMCKGDSSWQQEGQDENVALLSELKLTNPKKLKRLRERLVTPALHGGPCPPPSFPGCQEFFRDFISASSNPAFHRHLADLLQHKILEMNDVQLISLEVLYEEDEEIMVDAEDKETLLNCLLTTKLLAKFLGYVVFLPYNSPEVLPESMQSMYIDIRNKSCPSLDVVCLVDRARLERRTVITIPWVVDYLSMLDSMGNQLDYCHEIFSLLLRIYREVSAAFQVRQSPSQLLVLAVLGWLFELPCFPEALVYAEMASVQYEEGSRLALDNLGVVDQQILYSCCPYLGEVRSLLVDFAVGLSGRSSSVRKITPMAADTAQEPSPATVTDKQLQHQLEDNFFHNHPASLKKTVEFVADRVSSNHIKVYRTRDLPAVLDEAREQVEMIAEEIVQQQAESTTLAQKEIQQSVEKRASILAKKGKALCLESTPRYCSEMCQSILSLMLPEETPEQVWQVAALVSYRQALEKVGNWLNMHITTHMFKRELLVTADLEKQVRNLTKRQQVAAPGDTPGNSQPPHELSGGAPGLNTSGGTPGAPSAVAAQIAANRNSFMFESPVRALQNAALKPTVLPEESPMRIVLHSALNVKQALSPAKQPGSPASSKCIQNLSSFDKEPVDFRFGAGVLSSKLSRMAQVVGALHDRSPAAGSRAGVRRVGDVMTTSLSSNNMDESRAISTVPLLEAQDLVNGSAKSMEIKYDKTGAGSSPCLPDTRHTDTMDLATANTAPLDFVKDTHNLAIAESYSSLGSGDGLKTCPLCGLLIRQQIIPPSSNIKQQKFATQSNLKENAALPQSDEKQNQPVQNDIRQQTLPVQSDIRQQTLPVQSDIRQQTLPVQSDIRQQTLPVQSDIRQQTLPVQSDELMQTSMLNPMFCQCAASGDFQIRSTQLANSDSDSHETSNSRKPSDCDQNCNHVTHVDSEQSVKTDLCTSTTGILNRSGLGGKNLNVSFHEHADVPEDLDEVSVTHSTPSSSPSKALQAARTLVDGIPNGSPTKALQAARTLVDGIPNGSPTKALQAARTLVDGIPNGSPTKALQAARTLVDGIPNGSPTKPSQVPNISADRSIEVSRTATTFENVKPNSSPTKALKFAEVQKSTDTLKDDTADFQSPTEPLIALKECLRCVVQEPGMVSSESLCDVLHSVISMLKYGHKDVIVLVTKMAAKLSVDLAFTTALLMPDALTADVQEMLLRLWRCESLVDCVDFSSVFCARHLQLLEAHNKVYGTLVRLLLEEGLLQISHLVSSINQQLHNSHTKGAVHERVCGLLCDILPGLPATVVYCQSLTPLLVGLMEPEVRPEQKQILQSLLRQLPTSVM